MQLNTLGQIFGYLCAGFYLGSRLPQILLNYRRKSTEGVSILFFIFACLGNITYTLSILAFDPVCEDGAVRKGGGRLSSLVELGKREEGPKCNRAAMYARYMLVNAPWLLGSIGTLILDLLIFGQFWLYRSRSRSEDGVVGGNGFEDDRDVEVLGR